MKTVKIMAVESEGGSVPTTVLREERSAESSSLTATTLAEAVTHLHPAHHRDCHDGQGPAYDFQERQPAYHWSATAHRHLHDQIESWFVAGKFIM